MKILCTEYRENLKCCASRMSAKSLKNWASKTVVNAMVIKIKALLKNFGIILMVGKSSSGKRVDLSGKPEAR